MGRSNSGAAFGAFLGGALVGGVIALLFAPRSGAETRGMIRDYANEELDYAREKAMQARDMVEEQIDKYKRKARRAVSEIEDLVAEAKDCAAGEVAEVKKAARRVAKTQ